MQHEILQSLLAKGFILQPALRFTLSFSKICQVTAHYLFIISCWLLLAEQMAAMVARQMRDQNEKTSQNGEHKSSSTFKVRKTGKDEKSFKVLSDLVF